MLLILIAGIFTCWVPSGIVKIFCASSALFEIRTDFDIVSHGRWQLFDSISQVEVTNIVFASHSVRWLGSSFDLLWRARIRREPCVSLVLNILVRRDIDQFPVIFLLVIANPCSSQCFGANSDPGFSLLQAYFLYLIKYRIFLTGLCIRFGLHHIWRAFLVQMFLHVGLFLPLNYFDGKVRSILLLIQIFFLSLIFFLFIWRIYLVLSRLGYVGCIVLSFFCFTPNAVFWICLGLSWESIPPNRLQWLCE